VRRAGLPDWLVIARRELLERVRTWWFIVVTLLGPVAMIGLIVVPAVLAAKSGREGVRVVVVDEAAPEAKVAESLHAEMLSYGWRAELVPHGTPEAELLEKIRVDEIDGFLTIPDAAAGDSEIPVVITYQGDNATNQAVIFLMQRMVNSAVLSARAERLGLSGEQIRQLRQQPVLAPRHTTGDTTGTSGAAVFIIGYAVMFVLYMAIILYAVNVMRSVVQEKTNRVVEIMVAAAKPRALMLGKILGVGSVGLIQLTVWGAMALVTMSYREQILGVFGVAAGGWSLPPLGIDAVLVILAYFLLGYFFYASLYAAIGAMVSSDQEAQQAQTPVIFLLIVPMMCMQFVANDPRSTAAEVLTMLPISSPILMPMRYLLGGASGLAVVASLALLAASTWLVAWLAARIYRVGILMYGKRPSLRELGRWIRYS
jgi:ABC-2 type transport system permease protein